MCWAGTILGEVTRETCEKTGLKPGTKVVLGGHDNECALIAADIFDEDTIIDIVGTWEILITSSDRPGLTDEKFNAGLTVNANVIKGQYATLGPEVSGNLIEWARRKLFSDYDGRTKTEGRNIWDLLMELAAKSAPGANGVMVLPFFSGRTCIFPNAKATGSIIGLRDSSDRHDLIQAVLEGVNFQTREIFEALIKFFDHDFAQLTCIGGMTRNRKYMQTKSDITGKPVKAIDIPEGTSLGAAILAGVGVGIYGNVREAHEIIRSSVTSMTFEPNKERSERYNELFETYKRAYHMIKDIVPIR